MNRNCFLVHERPKMTNIMHKTYRRNIVISSGIAIFTDDSKRCNILLSQYIATKNAQPWSGGNSASKKLTCAKCNRQFHKAYGLQAHSLRCQVSCAPKRKFQCEICQSKLRMVGVKRHMVNKHQLKIEEYGALYFRRLFNCKICEVDIDMNKASVVGHMEKVHFLSLDKYCEHYGALHSHRSPGD